MSSVASSSAKALGLSATVATVDPIPATAGPDTITGGDGANVIYDGVGGDYAEPALRSIAWEGRYLVVGFPAGIPAIPLNLTLLKGCQIVGVFWGAFTAREPKRNQENLQELIGWIQQGKLKPTVSKTYPLAKAAEALNDMAARKVKGKVVLTMG